MSSHGHQPAKTAAAYAVNDEDERPTRYFLDHTALGLKEQSTATFEVGAWPN